MLRYREKNYGESTGGYLTYLLPLGRVIVQHLIFI
jgi:hypothetical protein